ncbi:unnamed protein product [Cyclocybe aegerita]|uniref:SGNH hydrolase-type esterase domain-containing protein n=1 Tax=Cyclocybe aegerita TaxID=1973307 RepID=A0A8S0XGT6_CYCAE|nr:unnamed protein product [Cyclocybe aegerita]
MTTINHDHPLIYYHGRWDSSPGTWWAGSGFKINALNLHSLIVILGEHTTAPCAPIAVSVDNSEFFTMNASAGAHYIPLPESTKATPSVVRINVEGWQNNRIHLDSIMYNSSKDAILLPYRPSKLAFQFIGDSLSAGQFLPLGVNQAWPFIVGERYKAEHRINAQPGATLTDIVSYGNVHGVSYQYFRTEDTGFYYTSDHNFTTPWNFSRDRPSATHIVIHIGANDASQGITGDQFVQVYSDFLERLRKVYPKQPIFIFTPWGWPNEDAPTYYYYPGQYEKIVNTRKAKGDKNIFLVDTIGWVGMSDVYSDNKHPNVEGHQNIANHFTAWLENWGLSP